MAEYILYDVADGVATITLDRPDRRNAQNQQFLEELNAAWERAAVDSEAKVILLRANGPHFSAGHDLSPDPKATGVSPIISSIPTSGLLGLYNWEAKHYFRVLAALRRDIPKPSIAAVQGACIAGGLMLAWPCDLIIAADNARFHDPVLLMGIGGVEMTVASQFLGAGRPQGERDAVHRQAHRGAGGRTPRHGQPRGAGR